MEIHPRRLHRHPRRRRSRVSPSGAGNMAGRAGYVPRATASVCLSTPSLLDASDQATSGSMWPKLVIGSSCARRSSSGGNLKITVFTWGDEEYKGATRTSSLTEDQLLETSTASWPPSHSSMDESNSSQCPSLPEAELTASLRAVDLNASCDRDGRSARPSLDFTSPRSPSAELSFEPRQSLLVRCREQTSKKYNNCFISTSYTEVARQHNIGRRPSST